MCLTCTALQSNGELNPRGINPQNTRLPNIRNVRNMCPTEAAVLAAGSVHRCSMFYWFGALSGRTGLKSALMMRLGN